MSERLKALIREAKEELGITIKPEDLEYSTIMHRFADDKSERIDFFFSCKTWTSKEQICEANKCDDLKWVEMSKLPENTIDYVGKGIECYEQNMKFIEFGWERRNA